MTKLFIFALLFLAAVSTYFLFRKLPLLDADGKESPYLKGGVFDDQVYLSRYVGDGLLGRTEYAPIPEANKNTFKIERIKVTLLGESQNSLNLGVAGSRKYLGSTLLPFDLETEPLFWINRLRENGPVVYVTKAKVYLLKDNILVPSLIVDASRFQLLPKTANDYSSNYSRDKNSVYYFSLLEDQELMPIVGADPKTFEQVRDDYGRDKERSYHRSSVDSGGKIEKVESDSNSDRGENQVYSKNAETVFYYGMTIVGSDAKTFEVLGHGFSRDENKVFYEDRAIPDIDPQTFQDLSDPDLKPPYAEYIKDKSGVYFCTHVNGEFIKVHGADKESFRGATFGFGLDRQHVFYKGKLLDKINVQGFKVLYKEFPMAFYIKNSEHVYLAENEGLHAVEKADAQSFLAYDPEKVRATGFDGEDQNSYFKNGNAAKKK